MTLCTMSDIPKEIHSCHTQPKSVGAIPRVSSFFSISPGQWLTNLEKVVFGKQILCPTLSIEHSMILSSAVRELKRYATTTTSQSLATGHPLDQLSAAL